MTFNQHQLSSSLASFVEAIFHFKNFVPNHSLERVVPTGHVFLIFELDGFPRHTFDNQDLQINNTFTEAWISGMHRKYITISAHEQSEMFVIQFKAHGAYPFLHFPIQQLNEKICPATTIFGLDILNFRKQLFTATTSVDKFRLAETWLQNRLDTTKILPDELLQILNQLQTAPATNFSKIMESYPHTSKHLIHQFKKYIGLTPKYYQRILRFNEILQKIQNEENISWTQIAYSCGFADQSHFIKEFKHFSGFNPQDFILQDFHKAETNFFPLDQMEN